MLANNKPIFLFSNSERLYIKDIIYTGDNVIICRHDRFKDYVVIDRSTGEVINPPFSPFKATNIKTDKLKDSRTETVSINFDSKDAIIVKYASPDFSYTFFIHINENTSTYLDVFDLSPPAHQITNERHLERVKIVYDYILDRKDVTLAKSDTYSGIWYVFESYKKLFYGK